MSSPSSKSNRRTISEVDNFSQSDTSSSTSSKVARDGVDSERNNNGKSNYKLSQVWNNYLFEG